MAEFNMQSLQKAGQIGGGILGVAGALKGAWDNAPRARKADRTPLYMMNQGFKPSDMEGLMAQFQHHQIGAHPISAKDLYDPSMSDAFNSMFGAGMSVYGATKSVTDNLQGTMGTTYMNGASGFNTATNKGWGDIGKSIIEQQEAGRDFSGKEGQNMLMQEFNVPGAYWGACGGPLRHGCGGHLYAMGGMFNNGAMLGQAINMVGAGLGVGINAARMAEEKRKAEAEASAYNFDLQYLKDREAHDLDSTTHDSKNNMFNMQAMLRRALGGYLFAPRRHAHGGDLHTQGADFPMPGEYNFIGNGGTHEQNPYSGVPQGLAQDGQENLVEENEVVWNNYVFSHRLTVPDAVRSKYKLREKLTFADAAEQLIAEAKERPNDPISQNGIEAKLGELRDSQEDVRMRREASKVRKQVNRMSPEELMALQQLMQQEQGVPAEQFAFGGHLFEEGGPKGNTSTKGKGKQSRAEKATAEKEARKQRAFFNQRLGAISEAALKRIASSLEGYNESDYNTTDGKQKLIKFISDHYGTGEGKVNYSTLTEDESSNKSYPLANIDDIQYTAINPRKVYSMTQGDWDKFFTGLDAYAESAKAGQAAGKYHADPNFSTKGMSAAEVEKNADYKAFKNYVKEQIKKYRAGEEADINAIKYAEKLDQRINTSKGARHLLQHNEDGTLKMDGDRYLFNDTWEADYDERNFDGIGGVYHFYNGVPSERDIHDNERYVVRVKTADGYKPVSMTKEQLERSGYVRKAAQSKEDDVEERDGMKYITHYEDYDPEEFDEKYEEQPEEKPGPHYPTTPMYAPLLSPFLADYTERDYSTAIAPREVTYRPIGDYLEYNPVDSQRYLTAINQQGASRRGAIQNMSGANRNMAMAQDALAEYQRQQDIATVLQNAEQINFDRRAKVGEFNRGTNMFNAQAYNQTEMANSRIPEFMWRQAAHNQMMRKSVDDAIDEAKSANITNFLDNLHAIGKENMAFNWANNNPAFYYGTDRFGDITYKPRVPVTERPEDKTVEVTSGAFGGMLTKKQRKGRR